MVAESGDASGVVERFWGCGAVMADAGDAVSVGIGNRTVAVGHGDSVGVGRQCAVAVAAG